MAVSDSGSHSRKLFPSRHSDLSFNNLIVEKVKTQKHSGFKLDKKLNFKEHLKDKFAIVIKGTGILKKTETLSSTSLVSNNSLN